MLLLLRVGIGVFMLTHGYGKLLNLMGSESIQFPDPLGVGGTASLSLAVFAEVFCSVLLILGAFTRIAAVPLLITMLVAAFIAHASDGFGKQELPLIYAIIYVAILIAGPGKYAVDNWIFNKGKRA